MNALRAVSPATEGADPADVRLQVLDMTELSSSKLFARKFHDLVLFVATWGWLVWDGKRWKLDDNGAVMRKAKLTSAIWYELAMEARGAGLFELANAYEKCAKQSQSRAKILAALNLAESEIGIASRASDFDTDHWKLNTANGTLELHSGFLMSPAQVDHITKITNIAYDPSAVCPTWIAFLERVLPDAEIRAYIKRAIGYCLTGLTDEQVLFLLYGSGANGKTTFVNMLAFLLGDYAAHARVETFMAKSGDGIPNDLAALVGARVVITTETEDGQRFGESTIKRLTGGDLIVARFLHREFFTYTPCFKIWIAANHLPQVRGTDYALWRRIHLVPFTETIPEEERDPGLLEKLKREATGILAWAVEGCQEWQVQGLKPPAAVLAATKAYRDEQDTIGAFITDCCVIVGPAKVLKADLFRAYHAWCEANNEYVQTHKTFAQRIKERGFGDVRGTAGAWWWLGIGLLAPPDMGKPAATVTEVTEVTAKSGNSTSNLSRVANNQEIQSHQSLQSPEGTDDVPF
jgi:putative DNA primase/helicase